MAKKNDIQDPLDTPVMRQYLDIKKQHQDSILLFRMGDFYELFLDDAKTAAPIMDVALTSRQGSVPMAGVPYHSAESYIARLIGAGKKVAIAEQSVDPENPKLMRRIVRRVLSSGTLVEESLLSSALHNYLMAVLPGDGFQAFALCDVSTGDFFSTCFDSSYEEIRNMYCKYSPGEILVPSNSLGILNDVIPEAREKITPVEDWKASPSEGRRRIEHKFGVNASGLGYDDNAQAAFGAVSLILHYLETSFPGGTIRLDAPVFMPQGKNFMQLDAQTMRNLDLVQNSFDAGKDRTLMETLDFTCTNAGKRFLKEAVLNPLTVQDEILQRQNCVSEFVQNAEIREKVRASLQSVSDLERILSRISSGRAAPRDFTGLVSTVNASEVLSAVLAKSEIEFLRTVISPDLSIAKLKAKIQSCVRDELPAVFGNGPFLREGVDEKLDRSRSALVEGSEWILQFEEEERKRTGIGTLKVKYNRVAGYFIEMSRNQAEDAPKEYRRTQTLVGNERFTCDRLQELEGIISGAEETISKIEEEFFKILCEAILDEREALRKLMRQLAVLDFLVSLSEAACRFHWIRPEISKDGFMEIIQGRHPVVEKYLSPGESFIPNDLFMNEKDRTFSLITGPNMAGKSTFIRQVGLLQLLMQVGSFVPADRCRLPIADCIFTRIGASDNLTRGESTFFVEMLETARILNSCSDKSLVIMDEVGRGTSTYDGLSIAWAIVEYLTGSGKKRPRVLFATHYHELTVLKERQGVFNLTMEVDESGGHIVFLHRVKEGQADRSYGIHVAKLAGIPEIVIIRAEEKLLELESSQESAENLEKTQKKSKNLKNSGTQPGLF